MILLSWHFWHRSDLSAGTLFIIIWRCYWLLCDSFSERLDIWSLFTPFDASRHHRQSIPFTIPFLVQILIRAVLNKSHFSSTHEFAPHVEQQLCSFHCNLRTPKQNVFCVTARCEDQVSAINGERICWFFLFFFLVWTDCFVSLMV